MNEQQNEDAAVEELNEQNTYPVTCEEMRASNAAENYMRMGIAEIDAQLGEGYAKANPVLLAGYLQSCAIGYLAYTLGELQARIVVSDEPLPEE